MRLAENTGRKISPKNRHLGTIAQLCRAVSSQRRHISTIGKKVLSSNTSCTCPDNMVNFGPLTADIGSGVWGHPSNFQRISRHLYSAGRPSPWALAHILVASCIASEPRAAHFRPAGCILYSHYDHIMYESMVDILSVTAEIRRGKKKKKKEETAGRKYKNTSGDEIANVNFFTTTSYM